MEDSSLTVYPYARVIEIATFVNLSFQILSSIKSFLDARAHAFTPGRQKNWVRLLAKVKETNQISKKWAIRKIYLFVWWFSSSSLQHFEKNSINLSFLDSSQVSYTFCYNDDCSRLHIYWYQIHFSYDLFPSCLYDIEERCPFGISKNLYLFVL